MVNGIHWHRYLKAQFWNLIKKQRSLWLITKKRFNDVHLRLHLKLKLAINEIIRRCRVCSGTLRTDRRTDSGYLPIFTELERFDPWSGGWELRKIRIKTPSRLWVFKLDSEDSEGAQVNRRWLSRNLHSSTRVDSPAKKNPWGSPKSVFLHSIFLIRTFFQISI